MISIVSFLQSSFIFEVIIVGTILVSASTFRLWQSGVLPVSVKDEGEVDVHDNDDWSHDEESLKHATWKNWALIEVGFTFFRVFFISLVAFLLCLILFLGSSNSSYPLL